MSIVVALMVLAAADTPAIAPKADLEDPVVCRKAKLPPVGTRFKPKPVCLRKSDWAMSDKQNETELRQINQRGDNPGHSDSIGSKTALSGGRGE